MTCENDLLCSTKIGDPLITISWTCVALRLKLIDVLFLLSTSLKKQILDIYNMVYSNGIKKISTNVSMYYLLDSTNIVIKLQYMFFPYYNCVSPCLFIKTYLTSTNTCDKVIFLYELDVALIVCLNTIDITSVIFFYITEFDILLWSFRHVL